MHHGRKGFNQRACRLNLEEETSAFDTQANTISIVFLSRCWCGGCELLDDGPDRYDRHGAASCVDHPCSGDATRQCGSYDVFSLYYRGTCGGFLRRSRPTQAHQQKKTIEVHV